MPLRDTDAFSAPLAPPLLHDYAIFFAVFIRRDTSFRRDADAIFRHRCLHFAITFIRQRASLSPTDFISSHSRRAYAADIIAAIAIMPPQRLFRLRCLLFSALIFRADTAFRHTFAMLPFRHALRLSPSLFAELPFRCSPAIDVTPCYCCYQLILLLDAATASMPMF